MRGAVALTALLVALPALAGEPMTCSSPSGEHGLLAVVGGQFRDPELRSIYPALRDADVVPLLRADAVVTLQSEPRWVLCRAHVTGAIRYEFNRPWRLTHGGRTHEPAETPFEAWYRYRQELTDDDARLVTMLLDDKS